MALAVGSCGGEASAPMVDVGGTWTVVDIAGQVPDRLDAPRLQFTVDGRIEGVTGCNNFSGQVAIDGDRIAVGALENTDVGCSPNARAVEEAFIIALRSAERVSGGRDTGRLILIGSGGQIVFAQPAP